MKNCKAIFFFIIVLEICFFVSKAQPSNDSLSQKFNDVIAKNFKPNEPGVSILIADKNGIIYKKAFGS